MNFLATFFFLVTNELNEGWSQRCYRYILGGAFDLFTIGRIVVMGFIYIYGQGI